MSIYIVGDIQGCCSELKALLKQVNFDMEHDELWVAGDLVARGSESLETLRLLISFKNNVKVVLGNHDLHLLATYAGIRKVKKQDKLTELLSAPDIEELMIWLAQQPLLQKIPNEDAYMSHAGISPQWSINDAVTQANFAHQRLKSTDRNKWLGIMYGEVPNNWYDASTSEEKFRYTINALTRMRYCFTDKTLEFNCKLQPENAPNNIKPWFELTDVLQHTSWIFGHWAALMGNCPHKNVYALDTGCVWGNHLTMIRWHDKKIFTENSHSVRR